MPKSELERVTNSINRNTRVTLEPLDTKKLLKGNPRETDQSKWVSKNNFKSIVSGESHRRQEFAKLRNKDEPYVANSKIDFRVRDKSKEIAKQDFMVRTGGSNLKSVLS